MALNFEQKKAVVGQVNEVASNAMAAVAAEYRGLTAEELASLRSKARESGAKMQIVKNSLAKRAFEGTDFECMNEALVGPLLLGFSIEDPGAAARVMKDFAKEHEALVVKAVSVGGDLLPASDLSRLASLPTRDQALSMLMGTMLAPITKAAQSLKDVPAQATRVVAAVRDQKQAA